MEYTYECDANYIGSKQAVHVFGHRYTYEEMELVVENLTGLPTVFSNIVIGSTIDDGQNWSFFNVEEFRKIVNG